MENQTYYVNQNAQIITPPFLIKQLKVINTGSYGIYINRSSTPPTTTKYDYYVAPNSNLVTPEISCNAVSYLAPSFTPLASVPEISLYDTANLTPFSAPYDYYQFVGFPGYPFDFVNPSDVFSLPPIQINKFQNVFFTLRGHVNMTNDNVAAFILSNDISVNVLLDIGAFMPAGGALSYVPRHLGEVVNPKLIKITGSNTAFTYTVNAFQSEDLFADDYSSFSAPLTLTAGSVNKIYQFGVNPPGFIWSLRGVDIGSSSKTISWQGNLYHSVGSYAQFRSQQSIVGATALLNFRYLVTPTFQMLSAPGIAEFTLVNNHPSEDAKVMLNVKNI